MVAVMMMESVVVILNGQVMIVQFLYLSVQTNAQIMVTVMIMVSVFVTLDG